MSKRISSNGQALHRAMMSRTADGTGDQPSQAELALRDERRHLKEEREKRQAQAAQPRPSAVDRLVRTHHAQPKDRPLATSEAKEGQAVKKPKAHRTRAEKHAEKAAALEAARRAPRAPKKPAK
ncbi:hypothetical protein ACPWT1_22345 [Ramlibacter sp. MMS24-I3-19]|uniref:hypothetical protein n=1 Tax=Ramlibacter sp. MMS24-I3-19 TaxID=3416606 RepID=UPI003D03DEEB